MTETGQLFDSGVNLMDKSFVGDFDEILSRSQSSGLIGLINIASDLAESETSLELIDKYDFPIYTTAGVHPHHAKDVSDDWVNTLRDIHQSDGVIAIGETGLDFNRNYSPPEQQLKVFEQQLEFATETPKPLYLHERDAHQPLFERLKAHRDHIEPSLLHCFTGDKQSLYHYLDLDLYIGLTGWVCDERRGMDVLKLAKDIPLNRLVLETDAPYLLPRTLSPKPKNRRNEPGFLTEVCKAIAAELGMSTEELAQRTTENALRLFKIDSAL